MSSEDKKFEEHREAGANIAREVYDGTEEFNEGFAEGFAISSTAWIRYFKEIKDASTRD